MRSISSSRADRNRIGVSAFLRNLPADFKAIISGMPMSRTTSSWTARSNGAALPCLLAVEISIPVFSNAKTDDVTNYGVIVNDENE